MKSQPLAQFILGDLTFSVREATLRGHISDPAATEEYFKKYHPEAWEKRLKEENAAPRFDIDWHLNIKMDRRDVITVEDGENGNWPWQPMVYYNDLILPRMKRWTDLIGQTVSWDLPFDPQTGNPHGTLYIWEHEDIEQATIKFVERQGTQLIVDWKGHANIFWDAKYGANVPFALCALVEFQSICVQGNWDDNDASMRGRLAMCLDPEDFVQGPIEKITHNGRNYAEAVFTPRGDG